MVAAEAIFPCEICKRTIRILNPELYIWVTLSPVLCQGTSECHRSITSDVVSKSLLRSALFIYMHGNKDTRLQYYPIYELVRGAAAHFPQSFFGADDGRNRHVNNALVDMVVARFIKINST